MIHMMTAMAAVIILYIVLNTVVAIYG